MSIGLGASAVGAQARTKAHSAAAPKKLVVGYFNGQIALPATVIGSVPSLKASVGVPLTFFPITTTGVAAMGDIRGGAIDAMGGVGVPPVVSAIGQGTGLTVVWAENGDSDQLIVNKAVKTPQALAGKTLGVTEGSTEAYELAGYLAHLHLASKVHIADFNGDATIYAAYVSGKIQGAYVTGDWVNKLLALKQNRAITNAALIGTMGYPSMSTDVFSTSFVKKYPATVQKYVCAVYRASKDMFGPNAHKYFKASATLVGLPASQAVSATVANMPFFVHPGDELKWLAGKNPELLISYTKVAAYLKQLGAIPHVPTRSALASHLDASFAKKALAGDCK